MILFMWTQCHCSLSVLANPNKMNWIFGFGSGIVVFKMSTKGASTTSTPKGLDPGEITPSYILHTLAFGTYLLGGYLPCKKDYKVMVFYM